MSQNQQKISVLGGTLKLNFTRQGEGRGYVVLHGGAGSASMAGLAQALSAKGCVVTPIHPGFEGTDRPNWCRRPEDLVFAYLALLDQLDLNNVVVIGNSFGGWLATELALRQSPRITGLVLLNAVGIDPAPTGRAIVDPTQAAPQERAKLAFHDPSRSFGPPSEAQVRVQEANQRTLRAYAGEPFMYDPTLAARLGSMTVPSLVVWGESDGIVSVDYGRAWANAMPGARFELIREAGHFPQLEQLSAVLGLIEAFEKALPGSASGAA